MSKIANCFLEMFFIILLVMSYGIIILGQLYNANSGHWTVIIWVSQSGFLLLVQRKFDFTYIISSSSSTRRLFMISLRAFPIVYLLQKFRVDTKKIETAYPNRGSKSGSKNL
ncbi:hypothetical protein BDA99DRAFT_536260 [Phascolomyces articulosus]|uniref:Uncharacterized protein n=1 Tax=Phascolomyces articulosus TaxID=60185 RepID=A0AAD5K375_9FUNG|nr:hypothetical protein BDA99DRAFT_536260 [Phascolomyces articulosus]